MYSVPVLYIVFVIPATCKVFTGQREETCTVGPKDKWIEINSSIEIECRSSCSPGTVYWTLNTSRIDDGLSETINSTYTVLSLRNWNHSSATIECRSSITGNILGGTTIRTYTKPSNIACTLLYVDKEAGGTPDEFTCSWDHKITSPMKVDYAVIFGKCRSCPQSKYCNSKTTSCTTSFIPSLTNLNVTVEARTAAWDVVSEPYRVDQWLRILQITPPKISVTALSNHLLVEWNRTHYESDRIHCQVRYKQTFSGGNPERVLNAVLNPMVQGGHVTIEEVEPCTDYTVSARCALDEAPWSKWSQNKTVLSQLNSDTVKFNLWRRIGEPNNNGDREVLAMWTTTPPSCKGDFDYAISHIRENDYTRYTKHMFKVNRATSCCPSSCHFTVDEEAHRIKLTVLHNGNRLREETVYIPAIRKSVPQVSFIQTSVHEGNIEVRWKAPEQNVSGYVIDWTYDSLNYFWEEIKDTNMTLTAGATMRNSLDCAEKGLPPINIIIELQDLTRYNITVTPLLANLTGHGTQALNICSREGVPEAINIKVYPKDKSARVRWHAADSQKQCCGAVVKYVVFYNDSHNQYNMTVDGEKEEALLTDLKPNTQYILYVESVARTGTSRSLATHCETTRFDPNLTLVLSICGGLGIFLVLFLGLCCAIQWKKFMKKMVPNPALSSLALWSSQNYQKIHLFTNPSESPTICERVYAFDLYPSMSGSQPSAMDNDNAPEPASDQTRWLSSGSSETSESAESEPVEEEEEQEQQEEEEETTESGLDPADIPRTPDSSQEERLTEPSAEPASSPEEASEPRAPGRGHVRPYRSQRSEEPPAHVCFVKQGAKSSLGTNEECKCTLEQRQQGKTEPLTEYITVDMFEQGQDRGREGGFR